jgi:hypothetical protein
MMTIRGFSIWQSPGVLETVYVLLAAALAKSHSNETLLIFQAIPDRKKRLSILEKKLIVTPA